MRITGRQLRRIIQEEVESMINEEDNVTTFSRDPQTGKAVMIDPKTGKPYPAGKVTDALAKRTAAAKARADELALKIKSNAYMNISLGSDIAQPFTTPSGKGILKITVQSSAMPAEDKYEVLDQSGKIKLGLNPDGGELMSKVMSRIKSRMLPRKEERPMIAFEVELPFTWAPGTLTIGTGGGDIIGFGGGEDYTADKLNGGISIMGIGFR